MNAGSNNDETRCAFIAVLGAPNVGKSTLVNRLVGAKVTIVSPKVQTTRTRVMGIAIRDNAQLVFIDTPGIFRPRRRLDRAMVAAAWGGANDGDIRLLLVDASAGIDANTRDIIEHLKERALKCHLAINKVDRVEKARLLELASELAGFGIFDETFMISALSGDGVEDMAGFMAANAPVGPWHFPEDQLSDMNERLLAAEITREKIYHELRQELPYAITVETESWEEKKDGSVRIEQVIFVERDSQKSIVLGKKGSMVKKIGELSRIELEEILGCRVHLFLFVKVREKWADDPERYRDWGLDHGA